MKKQYFISGLGADKTAFQNLEDYGTTKIMIDWISNRPNESLYDYAARIIEKYGITSDDILAGLSFGGLVAQQIADILKPDYVILISSFRTKDDLKIQFSSGLKLKLHKLMPEMKSEFIGTIVANYLNSGTNQSKSALKAMLSSTDMKLMKWSLEKIYEQNNPLAIDVKKYSLIGSIDRVVKPWKIESTYIVEGGSHFMVYDKAEEISDIIRGIVN